MFAVRICMGRIIIITRSHNPSAKSSVIGL